MRITMKDGYSIYQDDGLNAGLVTIYSPKNRVIYNCRPGKELSYSELLKVMQEFQKYHKSLRMDPEVEEEEP